MISTDVQDNPAIEDMVNKMFNSNPYAEDKPRELLIPVTIQVLVSNTIPI